MHFSWCQRQRWRGQWLRVQGMQSQEERSRELCSSVNALSRKFEPDTKQSKYFQRRNSSFWRAVYVKKYGLSVCWCKFENESKGLILSRGASQLCKENAVYDHSQNLTNRRSRSSGWKARIRYPACILCLKHSLPPVILQLSRAPCLQIMLVLH